MDVQLTPDQRAFARQAIESRRFHTEQDAVREALALWEQQERRRQEILAAVERADASHARGEGRRVSSREDAAQLAEDMKRRGMERLAHEHAR